MIVLVPIKRVIDYNLRVRVRADGMDVDFDNVKMSINPFDEIALEEAVRLKEKGQAEHVLAVSIGPEGCQDVLRTALALGADRALWIHHDQPTDSLGIAKLLRMLVLEAQARLVIMGKQAIDDDAGQAGQMLAALLEWPQACFVSKLTLKGDRLEATREVDEGLEILGMSLPAVVTADLRLNDPRFASLPNIMKARSKPLDIKNSSDYDVDMTARLTTCEVTEPPRRKAGVTLDNAKELVDHLREKGILT